MPPPPNPNFLSDYCYRFSEDECHPDFHFWSGMTLIGAMLGQRVWVNHGRFRAIPVLYTVLCGEAGSGKNSAMDVILEIMIKMFPYYLISDTIQSREDIIAQMASPSGAIQWKDKQDGSIKEYRAFFCLVDELSAFLSVDHKKMVSFLIAAYEAKRVSAGFKKDRSTNGSNQVDNPHLPIIACVQPDWFMTDMKIDLFKTGLGRRMCIVYRDKAKLNHNPQVPPDSVEGWKRVIAHLKKVEHQDVQGAVPLEKDAAKWFEEYYYDEERRKKSDDPLLVQFEKTEHMVLLRVALILSFCEYSFNHKITLGQLLVAHALLDGLKPDIIRLTGGIGNNPMAGVMQQMLMYLQVNNGMARQKVLLKRFIKDCPRGQMDFDQALITMQKTDQIVAKEIEGVGGLPFIWLFTPEKWAEYEKKS